MKTIKYIICFLLRESVFKKCIHVNVWQKPLQYCKVISLQLMKINGKKSIFLKRIVCFTGCEI